jgi:hypothetical protein
MTGKLEETEELSKVYSCRVFPTNKRLPSDVMELIQKASEEEGFIEKDRKKKQVPSLQYFAILKSEEGMLSSHEWVLLREVSKITRQRKGKPTSKLVRLLDKLCK